MDVVEKITASRTRQLLLVAAGLGLIAAILVVVYLVWLRSPYRVLFSDLKPADAATIVAELDKKKTPYQLADEGRTVLVPGKVADTTRLALMSGDLPLKGTVGFELFSKSDMGLTEFAQQINYRRALQGELARTIMALDGVETARVHLILAEPSVFRDDRRPSKASVTIIPRRGQTLPTAAIRGVQSLVAAAAPDLEARDVVVLDDHGVVISDNSGNGAPASATQGQKRIEDHYAAILHGALQPFFPKYRLEILVFADGDMAPLDADESGASGKPDAAQARFATLSDRTFPLRVKVLLDGEVSPEMKSEIIQLTVAAASLDPSLGDVVEVVALGRPTASDGVSASPMKRPAVGGLAGATNSPRAPILPPAAISTGLLLLLLVLGAAWLHSRRRGWSPRKLTVEQKQAYALRLQHLLKQEDAGVSSAI